MISPTNPVKCRYHSGIIIGETVLARRTKTHIHSILRNLHESLSLTLHQTSLANIFGTIIYELYFLIVFVSTLQLLK